MGALEILKLVWIFIMSPSLERCPYSYCWKNLWFWILFVGWLICWLLIFNRDVTDFYLTQKAQKTQTCFSLMSFSDCSARWNRRWITNFLAMWCANATELTQLTRENSQKPMRNVCANTAPTVLATMLLESNLGTNICWYYLILLLYIIYYENNNFDYSALLC